MNYIDGLMEEKKELVYLQSNIVQAVETMIKCYKNKGKILVCGNGGSASDSEHIVGELLKGFLKKRPLDAEKSRLIDSYAGNSLSARLQCSLPAISLVSQTSILTAVINDLGADFMFAQQVLGLGKSGDVLIGLTTSGNAQNVYNAFAVAKANGLKTIAFTGQNGGKIAEICDILINAPSVMTPKVQEYHLSIYHTICADCEEQFYKI